MNSFIKSLMAERNIKQKDLASVLGITSSSISSWDEEGTNISIDNLFSLSKLFHITVDELLDGKRTGESLEDKWKREYDINENVAREAQLEKDKGTLLHCLETVAKANNRFFVLLEKKIRDEIKVNEKKELEFLKQFYEIKSQQHHIFNLVQSNGEDINILAVIENIKTKAGEDNHEAILWELKNKCKIMNFSIDQSILDDFDDDIFFAWYNILTPIEKDKIITDEYSENKGKYQDIDYLYELIKRGGKILYTPKSLLVTHYDYVNLHKLEGKLNSVTELDNVQTFIYETHNNYSLATYDQYQALINRPRMRQIEMEAKYKKKDPIKYWEYIMNNEALI